MSLFSFTIYYFNYLYKWSLEISYNTENIDLRISPISWSYWSTITCNKTCDTIILKPWEYNLIVTSSWYDSISRVIKIKKDSITKENFNLEKIKWFELFEEYSKSSETKLLLLNKKLLETAKTYTVIWNDLYYLREESWKNFFWIIKDKNVKELEIPYSESTKITIQEVYMSPSETYLSIWDKKYIINFNPLIYSEFKFNENIKYIKKIWNNDYLFITDKWNFDYNKSTKIFEYKDILDDYVIYNWGYIWIILDWSKYSKKYSIYWDYLVKYNSSTKKVEKIAPININIFAIEELFWKIYITDYNKNKYTLSN